MQTMPDIKLTPEELETLRLNYFEYGGESHIAKGTRKNTAFKIFKELDKEDLTKERNENKLQKIILLYNKSKLKYNTRPLSTISVNGEFKGYELSYDSNDQPLLLATLTREEKIKYLHKCKDILLHFESFDIIYGDIKSDNILINTKDGKIKFCDMDNIQIGQYQMDEIDSPLCQFIEDYGKIDEKAHSYMHNLLTLNELDKDNVSLAFSYKLHNLRTTPHVDFFSSEESEIIMEILNPTTNYTGKYLIDYIKSKKR